MTTVGSSAVETSENIPLQKGRKNTTLCNCEDYLSGTKFINVAFGTLTVIITVALLLQIYYGDYQVVPHGSVATDSLECSKIGTSVLKNGGNSIDAAIASAFCLAVVTPHLISLDGDGLLLIYNHRKRIAPDVIEFKNSSSDATHLLPRLVIGLAYLHQQYGTLPWEELVKPAIHLASQGFLVAKMLDQATRRAKVDDPFRHLEPGRPLQLPNLNNTLIAIAQIPETELYKFITPANQPVYSQPLKYTFNGYDIYVPDSPSIGPLLVANLQQLESYNFSTTDTSKTAYIYRVAEVTQNLYNEQNVSARFHQGTTTSLAVMDLDDNYVSFTMGLYSLFGSGSMISEGYILNERNEDITCSRLPIIIVDASAICGRRLVFGVNDMALASQLIMSLVVAKENVTSAIEAPRFHIDNGSIGIEAHHTPLFGDDVLNYLETLTPNLVSIPEPYMSTNIVEKNKDDLNSHSDSRGGGIASRF